MSLVHLFFESRFISLEMALVLLSLAAVALLGRRGRQFVEPWLRELERQFVRFAGQTRRATLAVGIAALALRLALLPWVPIPEPVVTDEYSYLLAADTFVHGRLANPPDALWPHFESIHILQQPFYMSMYPPAQGLALAFGQVVFGHPWFGVWLVMGALAAALCWALQGWLPPAWALAGALLAVIRLVPFSYWMNSYWGGGVAALGGALVVGALPRLVRAPTWQQGLLFGAGVAVLANSRPFEGVVFVAAAVLAGVGWRWRLAQAKLVPLRDWARALAPACALLLCVGAGMLYYNWRLTGTPGELPYTLNRKTYAIAQHFVWLKPRAEPVYRHDDLRKFYEDEARLHRLMQSPKGFAAMSVGRVRDFWVLYLGPALSLALLGLLRRGSLTRALLLVVAIMAAALAMEVWFYSHYAAPLTAAVYTLVADGLRRLQSWRWRGAEGWLLVRCVPAILLVVAIVRLNAAPLGIPLPHWPPHAWGETLSPERIPRSTISKPLLASPKRDLVIVHYGPGHIVDNEWIYNLAELSEQEIVWARDFGPEGNAALLRRFPDRRVWLLEPDHRPPQLTPYSERAGLQSTSLLDFSTTKGVR